MEHPSVGLVLGGGGARGIAHVHVFEALDELGIKPSVISGTSIGSIMGAGYASGMSGLEIRELVMALFHDKKELLSRLWQVRPSSMRGFLKNGQFRIGEFDIEQVVEVFLGEYLPKTFEELEIPFTAVATDYYGHREKHFSSGALYPALAASSAIPAVFRPVNIDNRLYVDGGMCNPLPIDVVRSKANIVIAVDVVGSPDGDPTKAPGRIDVLFGASQLMMQAITNEKMKHSAPDLLLTPDVNKYRVLDFIKSDKILKETKEFKEEILVKMKKLLIKT